MDLWLCTPTMTLTLTLPPNIEALLQQRAEQTGQDVASIAVALLAYGLSFDEKDFFEALDGIQQGLDDFEQGRSSNLKDFVAEQNKKYGLSIEV